jgi:hypothetical protein
MWALFTRALTLATSSVQVSVINTSANFMATALLGMAVFGERLPRKSALSFLTILSCPALILVRTLGMGAWLEGNFEDVC